MWGSSYSSILDSAQAALLAKRQRDAAEADAAAASLASTTASLATAALSAEHTSHPTSHFSTALTTTASISGPGGPDYLVPSPNEAAAAQAKAEREWRKARLAQVRAQEALKASLTRDAVLEKEALLRSAALARTAAAAGEETQEEIGSLEAALEAKKKELGAAMDAARSCVKAKVAAAGAEMKRRLAEYDAQQERYISALVALRGERAGRDARAKAARERRLLVKDMEDARAAKVAAHGHKARANAAAKAQADAAAGSSSSSSHPRIVRAELDPMAKVLQGKLPRPLVPDPALKFATTRYNSALPEPTGPPALHEPQPNPPPQNAFQAAKSLAQSDDRKTRKERDDRAARKRFRQAMAKEAKHKANAETRELLSKIAAQERKAKVAASLSRARAIGHPGPRLRSGVTDIDEARKHKELQAAFETMFVPQPSSPSDPLSASSSSSSTFTPLDNIGALIWKELPTPASPPSPYPPPSANLVGSPLKDSPLRLALASAVSTYRHRDDDEARPTRLEQLQDTLVRSLPSVSAAALAYSPTKASVLVRHAQVQAPGSPAVRAALAAGTLPEETPVRSPSNTRRKELVSPFIVTPLSPQQQQQHDQQERVSSPVIHPRSASPVFDVSPLGASPSRAHTRPRDQFAQFRAAIGSTSGSISGSLSPSSSSSIPADFAPVSIDSASFSASESIIRSVASRESSRAALLESLYDSLH